MKIREFALFEDAVDAADKLNETASIGTMYEATDSSPWSGFAAIKVLRVSRDGRVSIMRWITEEG